RPGEGGKILIGRAVGSRRRNNRGIAHRILFFQNRQDTGDIGILLSNRDVNAIKRAIIFVSRAFRRLVQARLTDDTVNADRGFTGSTIADDQLALTPAYRNHGINCHNTGLDRLADTSAFDYTWRDFLQRIKGIGFDFAFAIERFSERVNHATKQSFADWDGEQTTGGLGFIPLRDFSGITEQDCTDFRFLEVQRQAVDAPGKF